MSDGISQATSSKGTRVFDGLHSCTLERHSQSYSKDSVQVPWCHSPAAQLNITSRSVTPVYDLRMLSTSGPAHHNMDLAAGCSKCSNFVHSTPKSRLSNKLGETVSRMYGARSSDAERPIQILSWQLVLAFCQTNQLTIRLVFLALSLIV